MWLFWCVSFLLLFMSLFGYLVICVFCRILGLVYPSFFVSESLVFVLSL
jgi:hypothetical protein